MFELISAAGYPPTNLNFCPECGSRDFPHTTYSGGKVKCDDCGLTCYIVEAEDSHRDEDEA
jgi:uncharacterized Zn finger protein (UPF0148 family)